MSGVQTLVCQEYAEAYTSGQTEVCTPTRQLHLDRVLVIREEIMGNIFLELTVANIQNMERQKDISFFVDTGATRAWIPQDIADELGIESLGTLELELADGTIKEFPYGPCFFSFGGEIVAGNVVIGPQGTEPLAGTHVLQDFSLVIDLATDTISRSRAMQAKIVLDKKENLRSNINDI